MRHALHIAAKSLTGATVALVLGFGFAQSVSAATRTSGPTARADCVEGDCRIYCQSIGFDDGICPANGGHCLCQ